MATVRVTVPATSANLGPGLDSMALALGLYNVVELAEIERGLEVELYGAGADSLPRHPGNMVAQVAMSVFRKTGRAPGGLRISLESGIPPRSGLGSSAAALLGGVVAANVLLGSPLSREETLKTAIEMEGHPNAIVAALYGGLVVSNYEDGRLIHASVPVAPMHIVVVLPAIEIANRRDALPQSVSLADAVSNIGRAALVLQALGAGDFDLLAAAMRDRLHEPARGKAIPGFEKAVEAARRHGAAAVAISGAGPALIAFAPADHEEIAQAMTRALQAATDAEVESWILPVDTQGISISEMAVEMSFNSRRARPVPASDTPAPWPFEKPGPGPQSPQGQKTQPGTPGPSSASSRAVTTPPHAPASERQRTL